MATSEWGDFFGAMLGKPSLTEMTGKEEVFYFSLKITDKGFEVDANLLSHRLNKLLSDFFANPDHIPIDNMKLKGIINYIPPKGGLTGTILYSSWIINCDDIQYNLEGDIAEACEDQFYDHIIDIL